MTRSQNITKEMTISEVVKKCSKAAFVFMNYGLHCIGCQVASNETIEEAAKAHQIEIKKFLEDLNKVCR